MATALTFNDLLHKEGIEPRKVVVMRHRPKEKQLRKLLPWWVHEAPELFNAYQRFHTGRPEKALEKLVGHGFLASFLGSEPGKATFAGVFRIAGAEPVTFEEFWEIPENRELRKHGMIGMEEEGSESGRLWFDLSPVDGLSEWIGKLTVEWPPPERSWWRRAERNDLGVHCIAEESRFVPRILDWRELVLSWAELKALPESWRTALEQWRGIYLIHDGSDGLRYVGSAYGGDNLMGRWLSYAKTGDGGNKRLRGRDPENFMFSILERVSPDMPAEEVIRLEAGWKERLHTRWPQGLNEN